MIRRTADNAEFQIDGWFVDQGWNAFEFRRNAWRAYLAGLSGLVHASTGTGKSYLVWLDVVEEALRERDLQAQSHSEPLTPGPSPARGEGRKEIASVATEEGEKNKRRSARVLQFEVAGEALVP